jgi:hypothetical protein
MPFMLNVVMMGVVVAQYVAIKKYKTNISVTNYFEMLFFIDLNSLLMHPTIPVAK